MQAEGIRRDGQVLPPSQEATMMPERLTKGMCSSTGDMQKRRSLQAG